MDPLFAIVIFVLGLCFGSFLNVCIHRLPRRIQFQDRAEESRSFLEKLRLEAAPDADIAARVAEVEQLEKELAGFSVVAPLSACPKCHAAIRPYDNIPVVSWLLLGGKCRDCKAPISPRYMAVELLTGLLFLLSYAVFGKNYYTFAGEASASLWWLAPVLKYCFFSFLILGLTFIDAEWQLLPDAFTIPGFVAGLLSSFLVPVYDLFSILIAPSLVGMGWPVKWLPSLSAALRFFSFGDSLLGAFIAAAFFYFIAVAYKRVRGREGMGLGDVKLMAMVGAFLGVRLTVLTIFGASLVGSVFGLITILVVWRRRTARRMTKCREPREIARKRAWKSAKLMYAHFGLPFGVFLGPMALCSLFFGNTVFSLYWRIF